MAGDSTLDPSIQPDRKSLLPINDSHLRIEGKLPTKIREACQGWIMKSPSRDTRSNYLRDLSQFLIFSGYRADDLEELADVRPHHVSAWRNNSFAIGLTNSSIRRKLTVLRSLFSYLQVYGFVGANPAHSDFVAAPAAPRDGKTVALTPEDCRRLLDAPGITNPANIRDRALFAVLAYTGCRVGELTRLRVGDYQQTAGHRARRGGSET